jgi:hypothetical protein
LTVTPLYCDNGVQYAKFFLILKSFSNISSLHFNGRSGYDPIQLSDLAIILRAVRNAPLRELSVMLAFDTVIDISPFSGPTGLKTCTIKHPHDPARHPREAMEYLYAFIEPSLDTLHYLSILNYHNDNNASRHPVDIPPPILDFCALRPACTQIRRFDYHTTTPDIWTLATFAEMFPDVEILKVTFDGWRYRNRWAVWTVSFALALSAPSE